MNQSKLQYPKSEIDIIQNPKSKTQHRRSELAVPGNNARFIARAAASDADLVFLDLEDAVAPTERPAARQQIIRGLTEHDWSGKLRAARVNPITSPSFYDDVITVVEGAGEHIDVIILPKVNVPGDVYMLDMLVSQIEGKLGLTPRITIEAQIETAQGMANVESIATASRRLTALNFGPGDYAASLGVPLLQIGGEVAQYPGHIWHAALSRIVVAARAAGIDVIDGPYGAYRDLAELTRSAKLARALGCDGKWAIHPDQIATINEIFSPTDAEVTHAQAIMDRYNAALTHESRGAVAHGHELIDAASLRMAERILAKGQGQKAKGNESDR
jgi:citrate lyase beta subunit